VSNNDECHFTGTTAEYIHDDGGDDGDGDDDGGGGDGDDEVVVVVVVHAWVSEWASEQDLTSPSTHYRSFWRRVFPVNHLHWYWQPNKNDQETEHTKKNRKITQPKKSP